MKPAQVGSPAVEELQAYCLGKVRAQRAHEIEAYLNAAPDWVLPPDTAPEDALLGHLRGVTELARPSTAIPCVPGYEVLAELGRGGMGVVYKARHLGLNRFVALKMILAGGHAGAAELSRFRQEAETGAKLQHANIVQVYEVGSHGGVPYLALEYVEGGTLAQIKDGVPLPRSAAELVEVLARAVDHAHQSGVIHRDLKPGNVLLGAGGVPKLSDFGLARRTDSAGGLTATGAILGTPGYLAPEQAGAQAAVVGPRTDVYGLGAILYYLLTGRAPIEAATPAESIRQTLEGDPVRPTLLRPGIPRDLETIALKCLQKDPARRYPTALALADDLRRFRMGEPIAARPVGRVERGWRWCRRNPAVAVASAAAVLLLLAVTLVSVIFALEQRRAASVLQTEKETTERTATQLRIETERTQEALKQSRSNEALLLGDRAIRICEEGEDGQAGDPRHGLLWLARAVKLAPTDDADLQHLLRANWTAWQARACAVLGVLTVPQVTQKRYAVWSPDGKQVLVSSEQGLEIWNVHSWQRGRTLPLAGGATLVAWSPDGRLVACNDAEGMQLRLWDLASNAVRLLEAPALVRDLNFSSDGKQLAAACGEAGIVFWDAANGERAGPPLVLEEPASSVAFHPQGRRMVTTAAATLQQWDVASRSPLGPPLSGLRVMRYASYSGDGKHFSVAARDPAKAPGVAVGATKANRWKMLRSDLIAQCAHLSPDGARIVVGQDACRAEIFDVASAASLLTISGHRYTVVAASFRPDGRAILTASKDGHVQLSAVADELAQPPLAVAVQGEARVLNRPGFADRGLRCLAFSPDRQWLFVGGWNENGLVLSGADGSLRAQITGHQDVITAAAFTPDGRRLLTGSADRTIRIWEVGSWRPLHEPLPCPAVVRYLFVARAGSLAMVGTDGGARPLPLGATKLKLGEEVWQEGSQAGTFVPDGSVLFGQPFGVNRWDTGSGRASATPLRHTSSVSAVAVDGAGKRVATGAWGVAQIWDLATGRPMGPPLPDRGQRFRVLAFSPDQRLLAALTVNGHVRFWDAATSRPIGPVLENRSAGNALVFHPDGATVWTTGSDALVRRWLVPQPVTDEADLLQLRTEVLTGMELDEQGALTILSPEAWRQRRQQLAQRAAGTIQDLDTE